MNPKRQRRAAILAIGAFALFAGCGGGDTAAKTTTTAASSQSAAIEPARALDAFKAASKDERARLIAERSPVSFVGALEGTPLYVGVITRGDTVEVYLCDSEKTAAWFTGTISGTDVAAANDTAQLTAIQSAKGLSGSVTLAGVRHNFTAVPAQYPPTSGRRLG